MKRLSAKFHIALGLSCLVVSLLLIASYLDLVPDRLDAVREGRAMLAEALAINSSAFISQADLQRLETDLRLVVARNDDILSAAVRRQNGQAVVMVGDHDQLWEGVSGEYSTDAQIVVPIWAGAQKWGQVELRCVPLTAKGWMKLIDYPQVQLVGFMSLSGFLVFYFYLSKMLRQLNPSQAIPARVRSAFDTMVEGLLVIDCKGYIVLANKAFATIAGKGADDMIGAHISRFPWLSDGDIPLAPEACPWTQAVREATLQKNSMLYLIDSGEKRRTFMVNCSPILVGSSKAGGALISFDDVTLLEEKEAELRKSKEEAEAANQSKSEFLANMSHEIRTPMNAILGFTELLKRGYGKSRQDWQKHLNTIHSSGQHLLGLINDILDLSKVESGRLEVERIPCAPHLIIREVLQVLAVKAQEKSISLELDIDGPIPETILTDPGRLRQTVTNLVGNALKFTDAGGVRVGIRLLSSGPQPQLAIAISDSGIGMPKDKLDTIFDPFVQADSSVTRKFGGTGLGLAISRRFVQALGGDITVASELGRGSVFTVTIDPGPLDGIRLLEAEHALAVCEETVAVSETRWAFPPARVLVVDDGHENRELVTLLLQEAGLQVDEAENGQAGVEKALQQAFDAILMDIQMPIMDGYTATRRLREQGIHIPIVALTANAMKGFEQDILAAGFSQYLTKPIDIDALMQTMADWVGGQHMVSDATDAFVIASSPVCEAQCEMTVSAPPLVSRLASNERFHAIIEKFVARLDDQLDAMATAWREKNFDELANLAHWLKGAGGTVGFDAFTKPAAHLELLAQSKCEAQIGEVMTELRQLANRIVISVDPDADTATLGST